jgi:hypothetical protein
MGRYPCPMRAISSRNGRKNKLGRSDEDVDETEQMEAEEKIEGRVN